MMDQLALSILRSCGPLPSPPNDLPYTSGLLINFSNRPDNQYPGNPTLYVKDGDGRRHNGDGHGHGRFSILPSASSERIAE